MRAHELALLRQMMDGLAAIDGLTNYGPRDPAQKTGVVLFTLDGVDPAEISDRLDTEFGIEVRVGLHCAPRAHRTIGAFPAGGVRMSPDFFNAAGEFEREVAAVPQIAKQRHVVAA